MGLRPGRCYTKIHRPYTRQSRRRPRKGYVKGVPKPKITVFEAGTKDNYKNTIFLISKDHKQIRHNALESARVAVTQTLEKHISKGEKFFFKTRVYPHHILRENAMETGAGADRFQQGMRASFGKPISTAAQVKVGQKIMEIQINDANLKLAKKAFKQAGYKLPVLCRIEIVKNDIKL